jgi:hypothetical protein
MLSELAQYQILFTFFIALLLQASVFTSAWILSLGHHHFVKINWDEYYSNLIIFYRHHHDSRESTSIAHILLLWIWPVPQDRQQRTDILPTVWTTQYKWANIRFKYSSTWFWSKWYAILVTNCSYFQWLKYHRIHHINCSSFHGPFNSAGAG